MLWLVTFYLVPLTLVLSPMGRGYRGRGESAAKHQSKTQIYVDMLNDYLKLCPTY
jgi:hypothetical protein